ncbi:MAG TPA: PIN domain nuclease [Chloroflexota bacterium]|nr:PIN domain nuclease [Chloroflexota bacterium]
MATLADSTVWIDHLNGRVTDQTALLAQLIGGQELVQADLILTEVLQGLRGSDTEFSRALRHLSSFPVYSIGGPDIAVQSAMNYRALRAIGITVRKTIDCLIATFCILNGVTLLHNDRDFDAFEQHLGLQVAR